RSPPTASRACGRSTRSGHRGGRANEAVMHGESPTVTVLLVVVAIGVGVIVLNGIASKIKFSAPLLTMGAAVVVSLVPGVPAFHLEPDLVLFVLLPPLLYAAA